MSIADLPQWYEHSWLPTRVLPLHQYGELVRPHALLPLQQHFHDQLLILLELLRALDRSLFAVLQGFESPLQRLLFQPELLRTVCVPR